MANSHSRMPGAEEHLTCSMVFLKSLLSYCQDRQINGNQVLTAAGLTPADLENTAQRIPASHYIRAFMAAERLSGDPAFGLHRGEAVKPGHYGAAGLLATATSDARELLTFYCRYQTLVYAVYGADVEQTATSIIIRVQPKVEAVKTSLAMQEAYLCSLLTLVRWLVGAQHENPLATCFIATRPPDIAERQRVFGHNIKWDQPEISISLPQAWFDRPMDQANPDVREMLQAHADEELKKLSASDGDPLYLSVVNHIEATIAFDGPTLQEVANAHRLSSRALQRKLSELGTSFSELVDQRRQACALRWIGKGQMSTTEAAYLLGFSSPQAFNRAFKRWTGRAPSEYRNQASG
ncbi:AraC family transcriptional regulator [Marinobacter confluentis]|uniref:AraC family transcriptional regulator n=1 Tax=Marinobacter confluentis TaxID=1697557 RepID=A0A4Z1CAM6_9GAMM|nr:AraC family transcriptional regulator [Marinobacter confluentis]TGN40666.1 AraC family transcriptional regulator [Marinobacter confluentis]